MQIGNRIFIDQDGEIILQTGEMSGDILPRKEITEMKCIDIPFGSIDYTTHFIKSIDPISLNPIIEAYPIEIDPDKQRIEELENQLLLMTDTDAGGIL